MQYVADTALANHGADDGSEAPRPSPSNTGDEESLYVVELPTKTVEESLGQAVGLGLRKDPDQETVSGLHAACGQATTFLQGPCSSTEEDEKTTCPQKCEKAARHALPILGWLPRTSKEGFKADLIAGLTVGVMVIPQSMSYASIAGLDLVYGLYASFVPTVVYAFFGTSGQLAVGPVALVSLLVEAGLSDALTKGECPEYYEDDDPARRMLGASDDSLAGTCPDAYADLVFVAMFFVGLIQFGAAICRLGFLINFLGHPVISGFTSGAAITIGLSQFKFWLGISIPKSQYCHETIKAICTKVLRGKAHWMPFLLGVITYYMLKGVKELATKKPKTFGWMKPLGPLIICTLSLVMMIIPGLGDTLRDDYGVQTIGLVPSGLPPFTLPRVLRDVPSKASTVLPTAISAALIGFMESIAIGKSIAAKHGEELSAGKELGAIGLANLIGSFAAGYPVAGSFSRSAVANSTGAKTPLAGLVTGLFVMLALVILPSFIRKLPKFVLATIVISSVVNLVAIGEAKHLWKVRKLDFMLWVIAFLGTLFAGVLYGLIIAVGMSLIVVLYESVRPQISVLWKLPGTAIYRNVKQGESPGQFVKGVLVVRVGASMYFANVAYIKDTIIELCRQVEDTKYVVVEMTPVTSVDSTALHMLEDLFADMRRKGVEVCLASIGSRVEETLRLAGVQRKCGYEWFHDNVAHAVEFCIRHAAAHKAVVGRLEADSLDMTETPSQGTLRMRRASNASSDNLEKEDKKSVLVMAAKHRVVERGKKHRGSTAAEAKALAALADADEEESKSDPSAVKPPPAPSPPATPAHKRDTVRALRSIIQQNGGASSGANPVADEPEAPAPPTIVCVADDDALDQILLVACDVGDRPGVLRDISDVLASRLSLQLRYNEAAVVGRRSISFWKCEVPARGAAEVAAAAAKAEKLIPAAL